MAKKKTKKTAKKNAAAAVGNITSKTVFWTNHAEKKMRFYHLSKQRVRRVLNLPKRIEEGIAPNTIAMMQVAGSKKHPYEIWTMIQEIKTRRKIISAWKYPGRTKPGEPLPEEILKELKEAISN